MAWGNTICPKTVPVIAMNTMLDVKVQPSRNKNPILLFFPTKTVQFKVNGPRASPLSSIYNKISKKITKIIYIVF